MYAKCLIRNGQLDKARKKLGFSIGAYPKSKSFRDYVNIELELLEFDRCRKIYEKWLEFSPNLAIVWIKYFELEKLLNETERAKSILKLAIDYPTLNTPEVVWKMWIDYETELENFGEVRSIYETLLMRTNHPKVWISFSGFEKKHGSVENVRKIFQDACAKFTEIAKSSKLDEEFDSETHGEERKQIFDEWLKFEEEQGDELEIEKVKSRMPNKVKKRRQLFNTDGVIALVFYYFHQNLFKSIL